MDGRPFGLQSGLRMGREKRETCRKGTTFYSCENGFRGCCNVDPCGPEGGCANSGSPVPTTEALGAPVSYVPASTSPHPTSTRANNITGSTSTPESTTTTFAISASLRPTPIPPAISTENASTSSFASSVSSKLIPSPSQSLSSTTSAPAVPLVPACPASNGTAFTDKSQIEYTVHCFVSNSYPPDHTIATSNSEYGECFASCSSSSTCAGFTYAPLDDGVCYLKSQMPKNLYMLENGLISYEKVNSSSVTAAPTTTPSQESGTKKSGNSSWSEIVGPVVAVVALTLLILLGVAFFVRARRKKARKRRVPFARGGIGGPVEINRSPSEKEEGNSRHISNGVFAPYGGSHYIRRRSLNISSSDIVKQVSFEDSIKRATWALTLIMEPTMTPKGNKVLCKTRQRRLRRFMAKAERCCYQQWCITHRIFVLIQNRWRC